MQDIIRICRDDESSIDLLVSGAIPLVLVLLVISSAACYGLNWLADYRNYARFTGSICLFAGPVVHWSLLFDLADERDESRVTDHAAWLHAQSQNALKEAARKVSMEGLTALHVACRRGNATAVSFILHLDPDLNAKAGAKRPWTWPARVSMLAWSRYSRKPRREIDLLATHTTYMHYVENHSPFIAI